MYTDINFIFIHILIKFVVKVLNNKYLVTYLFTHLLTQGLLATDVVLLYKQETNDGFYRAACNADAV